MRRMHVELPGGDWVIVGGSWVERSSRSLRKNFGNILLVVVGVCVVLVFLAVTGEGFGPVSR